jgi:ATP-binding cassette, subfamily B, multidrug efflux pump
MGDTLSGKPDCMAIDRMTSPIVFTYLQSRIRGTASPGPGEPPGGLLAFYWHFARQTWGWYALMFVTSLAVALIDTAIPVFIGKLVSLM